MARELRSRGHEVTIAEDCVEALGQVEAGAKFDLALIDVVMPSGSLHGIAFGRMLRVRFPDVPMIYITGYPEMAKRKEISGPLLEKPIDFDVLLKVIEAELAA